MKGFRKTWIPAHKAKELLQEGLEAELLLIRLVGKNHRLPSILTKVLEEFHYDIEEIMSMDNRFLQKLYLEYTVFEQIKQVRLKELEKETHANETEDDVCIYSNLDLSKLVKNSIYTTKSS